MSPSCEKTPSVAALNEKLILANVFSSPSASSRCLSPRFFLLRSDHTFPTRTHLHLLHSFAPHVARESQTLVHWTAGGSPLMVLRATVFRSSNTPPSCHYQQKSVSPAASCSSLCFQVSAIRDSTLSLPVVKAEAFCCFGLDLKKKRKCIIITFLNRLYYIIIISPS